MYRHEDETMLRAQCDALEADLVAARATLEGARSPEDDASRAPLRSAYALACAVWIALVALFLGATERAPLTTLAAAAGWIALVRLAVGRGMRAFRSVSGTDEVYTRAVILFYLPMAFVPVVGLAVALWRAAVLARGRFAPWSAAKVDGDVWLTPTTYPAVRIGRAGMPLAITFAALAALHLACAWAMFRG